MGGLACAPDFDFVFHRSSSDGVLSFVTSNLYHCEAHLLYSSIFIIFLFLGDAPQRREEKGSLSILLFTCVAYRLMINILDTACQAGGLLCALKFYNNAAVKKSEKTREAWD